MSRARGAGTSANQPREGRVDDGAGPGVPATASERSMRLRVLTLIAWTLSPSLPFLVLALPGDLRAREVPYFLSGAICWIAAVFGLDSPIVAIAVLPVAVAIPILMARLDHARGAALQLASTVACTAIGCINGAIGLLIAYGKHA